MLAINNLMLKCSLFLSLNWEYNPYWPYNCFLLSENWNKTIGLMPKQQQGYVLSKSKWLDK